VYIHHSWLENKLQKGKIIYSKFVFFKKKLNHFLCLIFYGIFRILKNYYFEWRNYQSNKGQI
jgi:hypothetical protein